MRKTPRSKSVLNYGYSDRARDAPNPQNSGLQPDPPNLMIGIVVDDRDNQYFGRIKVHIPGYSRGTPDLVPVGDEVQYSLRFLPILPDFGSNEFSGDEVAKGGRPTSWGLWAVPKVGNRVAVMFARSRVADGYYLGSVPPQDQTFMVPGAAGDLVEGKDEWLSGSELTDRADGATGSKAKRHGNYEFNDNVLASGLHVDYLRGPSSSSPYRETPTRVRGWKSPGDPSTRQIGHQFVMDDLPANQGFRIRSSRGHQVLFSDAGRCLYVSVAGGNAWVELTEDGKIDVYSKTSVNIHTEGDLNLACGGALRIDAETMNTKIGGDRKVEIAGSDHLKVDEDVRMQGSSSFHVKSDGLIKMEGSQWHAQNGATAPSDPEIYSVPGVPTAQQVRAGEQGATVEMAAARVPQHESWDTVPQGGTRQVGTRPQYNNPPEDDTGIRSDRSAGGQAPAAGTGSSGKLDPDKVLHIVVHCSANRPSQDIGVSEIEADQISRGWRKIAYHFVVRRSGAVENGRSLDEIGAAVLNENSKTVHICLVGGLNEEGKPYPDYRQAQLVSLAGVIRQILPKFPKADVLGHRDLNGRRKECPVFDAGRWWRDGGPNEPPDGLTVGQWLRRSYP